MAEDTIRRCPDRITSHFTALNLKIFYDVHLVIIIVA